MIRAVVQTRPPTNNYRADSLIHTTPPLLTSNSNLPSLRNRPTSAFPSLLPFLPSFSPFFFIHSKNSIDEIFQHSSRAVNKLAFKKILFFLFQLSLFFESIDRRCGSIDSKEKGPVSKFCIRSHGWAMWVSWVDRRIVGAINRTISWTPYTEQSD